MDDTCNKAGNKSGQPPSICSEKGAASAQADNRENSAVVTTLLEWLHKTREDLTELQKIRVIQKPSASLRNIRAQEECMGALELSRRKRIKPANLPSKPPLYAFNYDAGEKEALLDQHQKGQILFAIADLRFFAKKHGLTPEFRGFDPLLEEDKKETILPAKLGVEFYEVARVPGRPSLRSSTPFFPAPIPN